MIKYDYASKERQDFIKSEAKKVFVQPVEEYEEFHYEPESDSKFLIVMIVGFVLLMSLYLVNTQAKADGNCMPISPMSLVDSFGGE
jgi:hypothetical protein